MPLAALNDYQDPATGDWISTGSVPSATFDPFNTGGPSGYGSGGGYTPPPVAPAPSGGGFSFDDFLNAFPKLTSGIATTISAARGNPYSQTAGGAASSSPYGAVQPAGGVSFGATQGGLFGGISTTTLLIIGLAAFAFLGGRRR
jgi:hypothetical protein